MSSVVSSRAAQCSLRQSVPGILLDRMLGKTICILGFFRSGQVWLTRLLAQSIGCPVATYLPQDAGRDVAVEGRSRISPHRVTRSHCIWPGGLKVDEFVYIVRDPRDVAVSCSHYQRPDDYVEFVCKNWQNHIDQWRSSCVATVQYEHLHSHAVREMCSLMMSLGIEADDDRVTQAVEDQKFDRKLKGIQGGTAEHGWDVSWNERHMRKGVVGEWRSVLSHHDARLIRDACPSMEEFGYD